MPSTAPTGDRATRPKWKIGGAIGTRHLHNQVMTRNGDPTSRPGDSGSLWIIDEMHPVALNFAGTDATLAIANPMHFVLDALEINFGLTGAQNRLAARRPFRGTALARLFATALIGMRASKPNTRTHALRRDGDLTCVRRTDTSGKMRSRC